jgi:hypothetical protein
MRGTIRVIVGLVVVMGSVGGMDNAGNDMSLIPLMAIALAGLYSMYSGVKAMQ